MTSFIFCITDITCSFHHNIFSICFYVLGEMLIGPAKVLLMDEISNGLDSSTTFQIVTCLQQLTHITGYTTLVSLLQPDPETFGLFDDIILMAEGMTLYHGPKEYVLEFFESCGFRCPQRKGIADFLQEVCDVSLTSLTNKIWQLSIHKLIHL